MVNDTYMNMVRNVFEQNSTRKIKCIDNIFGDFLVNKGLYDEIEITKENVYELADLIGGHVKIDVYCPKCGDNRVFSCEAIPYYYYDESRQEISRHSLENEIVSWQKLKYTGDPYCNNTKEQWLWTNNFIDKETRLLVFKFLCAMDNTHHLDYIVLTDGNKMKKIGQYPSFADLTIPELKEYKKVISKEDEREYRRAVGLFSSGIGIGSFVYLRRIFERIIVSASQMAKEDGNINEEEFNNARVDKKIKLLAKYLPNILVNNAVFYGIVSKGIHELDEDECLEFFPVMHSFIMMVLRQWEKIRRDREEEKQITASLNKIATKVK